MSGPSGRTEADQARNRGSGRCRPHRPLPRKLRRVERKAGTFCSLLGVTQYLSRKTVEDLFGFAASLPAQSEIVFSFVPPDDELAEDDFAVTAYGGTLAETLGEPWKTRLRPSEAFTILTYLGFGEVLHLTPKRAHQRYFAGRSDAPRASGCEQLMAATV
jgi:O-methyltransferase involved in polyketide biosynthesis